MKLKDISREAGVAVSTVSRVLKDPDSSAASPETKEKIFRIALRGGYISEIPGPDSFAEQVPLTQPSRVLYCMLAVNPEERNDSPFFNRLIESIRASAHHYNYIVEYYFPSNEKDIPARLLEENSQAVRGIIVIGRSLPSFAEELKKRFDNILYIGLTNLVDLPCDQIICSGYRASMDVVKMFLKHGHKRIGFVGPSDDDRINGYFAAMERNHLAVDENMYQITPMSYDGGYNGMKELLKKQDSSDPITAVFCANDNSAIGALQACKEMNVRVPEDICLIGMDGSEMTKYMTPSISTVHTPLEEMGKFAVRVLRDRMHGGHSSPLKIYFPYDIVRRGSGPLRNI